MGRPLTIPLLLLSALGCAAPQPSRQEAPPELALEQVGIRMYRGGTLRAIGHADSTTWRRARSGASEGMLVAERGALAMLPAEPGASRVVMKAEHASGKLEERVADATGGVELKDDRGTVGRTEAAHYDARHEVATGTKPVDVTGKGFRIHGEGGFTLRQAGGGQLELQGPVTTVLEGQP